jgi:hypothetical protein
VNHGEKVVLAQECQGERLVKFCLRFPCEQVNGGYVVRKFSISGAPVKSHKLVGQLQGGTNERGESIEEGTNVPARQRQGRTSEHAGQLQGGKPADTRGISREDPTNPRAAPGRH